MADWTVHYYLDGVAGILPDIPLACGILLAKGQHIEKTTVWYKLHCYIHHPISCFLSCWFWFAFSSTRLSGITRAWTRHILLDYMTHKRGWLYADS